MGGACKIADALDDDMASATVAGNTVYIKNGSYTAGAAITFTAGTAADPTKIVGYNSTRSITANAPTGTDRPSIDIAAYTLTTGNYNIVKNLSVACANNSANCVVLGSSSKTINCKFSNSTGGASYNTVLQNGVALIDRSEISNTSGRCIDMQGSRLTNSHVHDCTICVYNGQASNFLIGNVIRNCSVSGFYPAAATSRDSAYIYGNTFYGANDADAEAIDCSDTNYSFFVRNNIFADWFVAIDRCSSAWFQEDYNIFASNGTDISGTGPTTAIGPNSITQADLTNVEASVGGFAAANFSVGSVAKAKAYPAGGYLPGLSAGAGYTDMGALQRVEPTGGGAWAN